MKLLTVLLVAGVTMFAQKPGSGVSPTGFGRLSNPGGIAPSQAGGGFGRIIYPGTGGPPAVARPGTGIGARPLNIAPPVQAHASHGRTTIVPYPVYYGGYYYGYDAPPVAGSPGSEQYANDPGYAYDPTSAPQSPVVIINQNFQPDVVTPVMRDYSNTPLPPPSDQALANQYSPQPVVNDGAQLIFLIAMSDHTIYPAVAYWVEGDTLNYMTPQGVHNRVTLDLVDRPFTAQLNKDRGVDFGLPPAAAK